MIVATSRFLRIPTLLALFWTGVEAAASTPTQLYNKTILLAWSVDTIQRRPDGTMVSPRVDIERTIYVSTAGRLFVRTTKTVTNRRFHATRTNEMAPGDNRTLEGMARQLRFEGRRLIGHLEYYSGAGQMTVDFDPNFLTCTMNLVYGKQGGAPIRWKAMDGTIHEVISVKAVSPTCSIKDGNAFAGG
jgi:hypothetical protein